MLQKKHISTVMFLIKKIKAAVSSTLVNVSRCEISIMARWVLNPTETLIFDYYKREEEKEKVRDLEQKSRGRRSWDTPENVELFRNVHGIWTFLPEQYAVFFLAMLGRDEKGKDDDFFWISGYCSVFYQDTTWSFRILFFTADSTRIKSTLFPLSYIELHNEIQL